MTPDETHAQATHAPVSRPRRVLVVDDHAPTLAAVAALLQREYPDIEVVGTAGNGEAALRIVRDAGPDVVVLDLSLGDEYGLDLMPAIGRHPGVAVIVLTSSDDPLERSRALASGAVAFVNKLSPATELIGTILAVQPGADRSFVMGKR